MLTILSIHSHSSTRFAENYIYENPSFHSVPNDPAGTIGTRHTLCIQGTTGGTNGSNSWTVHIPGGGVVSAVDVSEEANSDPASPRCDTCSCSEEYIESVPSIGQRVESALESTGFAAFILTIYENEGVASINVRSRLCYGVPNRYLSVLVIREVSVEGGIPISFRVTSAQNRSAVKNFTLPTGESKTGWHFTLFSLS